MGKVKVRTSDGRTVEVDQEVADALSGSGGATAHKETKAEGTERARKTTIDKNGNDALAFVGSAVNSALAGIPAAVGLIPEGVKEDIEARPTAAFLGEAASFLAPTGVLGKTAKAVSEYTVMGQAAKLGGMGNSFATKAAARAGEGAIQSAAGNLSHVTLSNDPLNVEALVADISLGSVLNVAFGAVADRVTRTANKAVKSAEAAVLSEDATALVKLKQDEAKSVLKELSSSPEYAEARDGFNAYNTAKQSVNNRVNAANEAFSKVSTPESVARSLKMYEGVQGKILTTIKRLPAEVAADAGGAVGTFDDLKAFTARAEAAIPLKPLAGSMSAVDEAVVEPLARPAARSRSSLSEAGFEERMPTSLEDTLVRSELGEDLTNLSAPRSPLAERIPGMQMMRAAEEVAPDVGFAKLARGGEHVAPARAPSSGDLLAESNSLGKFARGAEHMAPTGLDDAARFADSSYQSPKAVFGGLGDVKTATMLDAAASRTGGKYTAFNGERPTSIRSAEPERFIDDAADDVMMADDAMVPAPSTPSAELTPRQKLESLNQHIDSLKEQARRLVAEGDYKTLNHLFSETNEKVLDTLGGANLPKPAGPAPVPLYDVPPSMPKDMLKLIDMQDASIERIAAALTPEVEQKLVQLATKLGQEATGGATALYGIRGHLKMTKALSGASKAHLAAKAEDLAREAATSGKLEWTFKDGDVAVKLNDVDGGRLARVSEMRKAVKGGTQSMLSAAARRAVGGLKGIFIGRLAYGAAGWAIGGMDGMIAGLAVGGARAALSSSVKLKMARAFAGTATKLAPLSSAMAYLGVEAKANRRDGRAKERIATGSMYDPKSVRAAIDAVHVQAQAAPDAMYEFVKPLMGVTGDIAFAFHQTIVNSLKYLSAVAPKDPGVDITPTGSNWEPAIDECHEFLHRCEAVFNPMAYSDRVLAGEGHPAGIEAMDATAPNLANLLRTEAINHMTDDISSTLADGLSLLMRGPVTAAQDPDLFLMSQAMFASARGAMGRAAESAGSSNPTGRPPAVQSPTAGSRVSELTK